MIEVLVKSPQKLLLKFDYNPFTIQALKNNVGGCAFVPKEAGGPGWSVPYQAETADILERLFGWDIIWPDGMLESFEKDRKRSERFKRMSVADSAELKYLPESNPALHAFISGREYQLADVQFMARADNCFNLNDPGTGKTVEAIASVFEAVLEDGPVLIIAPLTSLDATWLDSLDLWLPGMPGYGSHPAVRHTDYSTVPRAYRAQGLPLQRAVSAGPAGTHRQRVVTSALKRASRGEPIWLVVNPESVRRKEDGSSPFPGIYEIHWNCVIVDEFHKMGVATRDTLFSKSIRGIKSDKLMLMSGTPMGGKPAKLWAPLNLLYPDRFPGYWEFVGNWLSTHDEGHDASGRTHKVVEDVKKHRRDEFNEMLAEYMVRRQKKDIMQWLPPKQYTELWVRLEGKQEKQYLEWEADSEILIDEQLVDAVSILAVYTRLRQFANCQQRVEGSKETDDLKLYPTGESAKFEMLWEVLEELGITDPDSDSQVVIFSQFTQYVNYISERFDKKKLPHQVITGETKMRDRKLAVDDFQAGDVRVMLMNTHAGGVSITLDRADNVIFMDETWNPDDQTQAEDRTHRGEKTSQVMIYRILAKGTIDEYISKGNITKESINDRVLNNRKKEAS